MIIKHEYTATKENGEKERRVDDITRLVEKSDWSGSRLQAARRLQFVMVQDYRDPNIPNHPVDNGDTIYGYDEEGKLRFQGTVFKIEKDVQASQVTVLAYDILFILNRSKTTRKFTDISPEDITSSVCSELGVKVGSLAKTGAKVSFIAVRKSGYQIILMAYTEASKQNGKKYAAIMNGDKLDVVEKGTLVEGYTASGYTNVLNERYSESIENEVNQVMITDAEGNATGYKTKDDEVAKYGMVQEVYKTNPKAKAQQEIESLLHGPDREGVLDMLGDYRIVAPYSIAVQEQYFKGQFWIKSDSHHFEGGMHTMKLELEFENIMTEDKVESNGG